MTTIFRLTNVNELVTVASPNGPKRKADLNDVGVIKGGSLAWQNGTILAVGEEAEIARQYPEATVVDCENKVVMPGFVDPHTHLPFFGTRENDFEAKIQGKAYAEIAKAAGGIHSTVRATRAASYEQIIDVAHARLDRMLAQGTTSVEAKSGYGLELETEKKQLKAIQDLRKIHPVEIVATNLAAHEIPVEYRDNKQAYIDKLCNELLPELREYAEFCDIFCEAHVFNRDESYTVLKRAAELGYKIKIHADEIKPMGGAELAAELNAVSADHLGRISDQGIEDLAKSDTVAVLLPGTTFYLKLDDLAPARKMINAGVAVALATDLNPGSCLTESMPMILTIGCTQLRMTPAEVICAATINSAHAIDRGDQLGSLEAGKSADFVVWDVPTYKYLPTHFGVNLALRVFKLGELVAENGAVCYRNLTTT